MNYSHNIRKLTNLSYLVSIVLENKDALKLKSEFDRDLIKNSHVEGFRKGKAPLHVVINKYGHDKYYKDMREYIAQKAFEEATKNNERIKPLIQPKFEFADWEEGGKFVFTATVFNEPQNPSDLRINPEIYVPPASKQRQHDALLNVIPGQMPIIDGKLPPHLAGIDPTPKIPNFNKLSPEPEKVKSGSQNIPNVEIPKRPDQLLEIPTEHKVDKKESEESSSQEEPSTQS